LLPSCIKWQFLLTSSTKNGNKKVSLSLYRELGLFAIFGTFLMAQMEGFIGLQDCI